LQKLFKLTQGFHRYAGVKHAEVVKAKQGFDTASPVYRIPTFLKPSTLFVRRMSEPPANNKIAAPGNSDNRVTSNGKYLNYSNKTASALFGISIAHHHRAMVHSEAKIKLEREAFISFDKPMDWRGKRWSQLPA